MQLHFLAICIACTLQYCASQESETPKFQSSRLQVATVLDLTAPYIKRDTFTLIRSLRLFGGTLNEAGFVVCIPLDNSLTSNVLYDSTQDLSQISHLGVEIVFIEQTKYPYAKTLNKFGAFSVFDTARYDYFLWLDADVTIFGDPSADYFRAHRYPGAIECAPDFYSYLRRYPAINTSNIIWNPSLSSFHLLGNGEYAPHGACNTGVLLFDKLSLQSFLSHLPYAEKEVLSIIKTPSDRFLDSLLFVAAVNRGAIEVTMLSYALNYMALFEVEIVMETDVNEIFFAHFLSDTEMYCYNESPSTLESCRCLYGNDLMPSPTSSLIRRIVQISAGAECNILAGVLPVLLPEHRMIDMQRVSTDADAALMSRLVFIDESAPEDVVNDNNTKSYTRDSDRSITDEFASNNCTVLWPPPTGYIIPLVFVSDALSFTVDFSCQLARPLHSDGTIRLKSSVTTTLTNSRFIMPLDHVYGQWKNTHPPLISYFEKSISSDRKSASMVHASFSVYHDSPFGSDAIVAPKVLMTIQIDVSLELLSHHPAPLSLVDHEQSRQSDSISNHRLYISGLIAISSLLSAGSTSYSFNPLLGSKPISLSSQLRLPEYLNARLSTARAHQNKPETDNGHDSQPAAVSQRGALMTGVTVCCDSVKGFEVTKHLAKVWRGDVLFVILTAVPGLSLGLLTLEERNKKKDDMVAELTDICHARSLQEGALAEHSLRCIISPSLLVSRDTGTLHSTTLAKSMPADSLAFVYVDVFAGFVAHLQLLHLWFESLAPRTGLLMGSIYQKEEDGWGPWNNDNKFNKYCDTTTGKPLSDAIGDGSVASTCRVSHFWRPDTARAASAAADSFSEAVQHQLFMTYAESSRKYCADLLRANDSAAAMADFDNMGVCPPAWFLFKLRSNRNMFL